MLTNWVKGVIKGHSLSETNIHINSYLDGEEMDLLDQYSVALLSSDDDRPRAIKESLSVFYNQFENIEVIDLGYFRKDDPSFINQLMLELQASNILPVVIDKDFRWFSEVVSACSKDRKTQNICVSNKIQFSEFGIPCDYLGFQRHLLDMEHITRIGDHSINSMSLGKVRAEVTEVEPVLRDVEYAFFDVAAFRICDAPGSMNSMPSGLTCEEACQLMKYLGKSNNLKLLVLGGDYKIDPTTSNNLAQMIWYLMEGKNSMSYDHPQINRNYNEYIVDAQDVSESFTFVKNSDSGRWWFCLEDQDETKFISCSYNEYQKTISDELPVRLLKHFTKY